MYFHDALKLQAPYILPLSLIANENNSLYSMRYVALILLFCWSWIFQNGRKKKK
jgi:hypothetical protein